MFPSTCWRTSLPRCADCVAVAGISVLLPLLSRVLRGEPLCAVLRVQELEVMVCGNPIIDLDLLARMTTYHRCGKDDAHVKYLWEVLREFDEANKQAFVMFVSGRSRLPRTEADFENEKFQVTDFHVDGRLQGSVDE